MNGISVSDFAIPVIFAFVLIFALCKKVDIFTEFIEGVKEGVKTISEVFPALFALVLSVGMFRASGATAFLSNAVSPLSDLVGFPNTKVIKTQNIPLLSRFRVISLDRNSPNSFSFFSICSLVGGFSTISFISLSFFIGSPHFLKILHFKNMRA